MRGRVKVAVAGALVAATALAGTVAFAGGGSSISETLSGYQEDPLTLSTTGTGEFQASIRAKHQEIKYQLSYSALEGNVTQAHIHFGGRAQSGGIAVFLCSNLGNGPAGTQLCPAAPATISGTIKPVDVIGPGVAQGLLAGEFDEFVDAIRGGVTYANVHSSLYPGGEIRAQLQERHDD